VHRYAYDSKHRLIHYAHTLSWSDGHGTTQGDYIYDPLGRRVGKRILHLSPQGIPREDARLTWYGWDGDRLVLTESDGQRVHTLYQPGSFVPLLRIEGDAPPVVQTLVQTLEQDSGMRFEPEVSKQLHRLEGELRAGTLSAHSQQWLKHAQLSEERLQALLKPLPELATPLVHLYHCDHLGTPLALINQQGGVAWQAEFDAWGNQVAGRNPQRLYQPIRMQGQHYDEETGLHYNRHRYYDPILGRYINQDPIGLNGGVNPYQYPLNPIQEGDPLGLKTAIIGNGPVSDNPFGHGALAIEGFGVISYGTGDYAGKPLADYFQKMQPRRDSWIWIVDTTPEQEQCMINEAKNITKNQGELGIAIDNCFSRTNQIFDKCGYSNPVLYTNMPESIPVLGELYGSGRVTMPKGPFTELPPSLQVILVNETQ
jgi:RHS repeat-associated protein